MKHIIMVKTLKIVFPLVAAILLSAMFMMAERVPELSEIPFASGSLKERTKRDQVAEPNYMGMTKDGDVLNVFAEELTPQNEAMSEVHADRPMSEIKSKEGRIINLISDSGLLRNDSETMTMQGAVEIITSDGYRLTASKLDVKLDQTWAFAHGPVRGVSPSGTLTAGSLEIKRISTTDGLKYYFYGGVKVLYNLSNRGLQ